MIVADVVSLAVGLHTGYGQAQRLYIKRGYIPDGTGVWYQGQTLFKKQKSMGLRLKKHRCKTI